MSETVIVNNLYEKRRTINLKIQKTQLEFLQQFWAGNTINFQMFSLLHIRTSVKEDENCIHLT